ncbi:MAG: ABC transporter permease subunit [Bacteroidota bacterium]
MRPLSLSLFFLLAVGPLLLGIGYALAYSLGLVGLISEGMTADHWVKVVGGGEFWASLGTSAYVATMSIGIALLIALMATTSRYLNFQEGTASYAIYLPLTLPAMVTGFLIFLFLSNAGIISRVSHSIGLMEDIQMFPNLVNDVYSIGIIAAHTLMATPFFIILFANLYKSERIADYAHLAATLGGNRSQISRKVVFPMLLRPAFPTLVLYLIFVMGSYEIPLLLGRQSPQMVSVLAINKLQRFNLLDKPQAYVISLVYTFIVLSTLILLFWRSNTRLKASRL